MAVTSTIQDWIVTRERSPYRTNLFYNNGYLILHQSPGESADVIRFPFYNVYITNRELFNDIKIKRPFDRKYFYQPKKLSLDLYGDIGLWHVLLVLNKCRSVSDFFGDKVYILNPEQVMDYMSRMFVDSDIDTTIYDT